MKHTEKRKAVLSQGEPRDAAANFDRNRIFTAGCYAQSAVMPQYNVCRLSVRPSVRDV